MYRIYFVLNGVKHYDVNIYTEREAKSLVRECNKDFRRDPWAYYPYFLELAK